MNLKVFEEGAIYETINTLMLNDSRAIRIRKSLFVSMLISFIYMSFKVFVGLIISGNAIKRGKFIFD